MRGKNPILLLLFTCHAITEASGIIFPGQLDHAEGDSCSTPSGRSGICSRSCQYAPVRGDPVKCGIKNSAFLVCCEQPSKDAQSLSLDITSPRVTFQCGRNERNMYELSFTYVNEEKVYIELEDYNPIITVTEVYNETTIREYQVGAVGAERAEKNAWPWMALVGERSGGNIQWFCGGVLINDQWVLSALHCFFIKKPDVVRLGEHNYKDDNDGAPHQDFSVVKMVTYPDYNPNTAYHDLILLKLSRRVEIQKFISPVCLPWGTKDEEEAVGRNATLTGYGDTQFGGLPTSYLQEVNLTVFSSALCDQSYSVLASYPNKWPRGIGHETLCAGDRNGGRDACQGDSGGPLMSQDARGLFVLAGIVSRGYGCGHKDYPGLYANVRHRPYLAWIKQVAFAPVQ